MNLPESFEHIAALRDWRPIRELLQTRHGMTCLVRHQATGEEEVLKWLRLPASASETRKLLAEMTALRAMAVQPQITVIHDIATQHAANGQLDVFIRMEALTPLTERLRKAPLTIGETAPLVSDMAEALSLCHAAGVVHGNLKPANILCTASGYKLSDPGVSLCQLRRTAMEESEPGCQPPEQRSGHPASPLWDVYGLGMTLYMLFNGGMLPGQSRPGADAAQAASRRLLSRDIQSEDPLPPPAHAPEGLAAVVLKALSADPAQRHASAAALAEAYAQALAALDPAQRSVTVPVSAASAPSEPSARKKSPRAALLAVAAVLLLLGGALFAIPALRSKEASPTVVPANTAEPTAEPTTEPTAVPLSIEVTAEAFSASVAVSGLDAESARASIRIAGAAAGRDIAISDGQIELDGLAPDAAYTLTLSDAYQTKEVSFTTSSASTGRFSKYGHFFLAINDMTFLNGDDSPGNINSNLSVAINRFPLPDSKITLGPNPASSQLALILFCQAECKEFPSDEGGQYHLVLKAGDDVIVHDARYAPVSESGIIYAYHNFSPLLDEYFARYGTNPSGQITLQVYWLGEMVCDTQLTVIAATP